MPPSGSVAGGPELTAKAASPPLVPAPPETLDTLLDLGPVRAAQRDLSHPPCDKTSQNRRPLLSILQL
eukprot:4766320-Prymnesium_polylepis.1